MTNSDAPMGFEWHVVNLKEHPGLICRFLKPTDFVIADVPHEVPDFEKSPMFMPLAVTLTQLGPVVFSLGARPAFGDGTVSQWLDYVCREENYEHSEPQRIDIGGMPGVTCDAMQSSDAGLLQMRFVMIEDGGRLFQMSGLAPQALWKAAVERIDTMLRSFELAEKRGTQVPLFPGESAPVPAPVNVKINNNEPADNKSKNSKNKNKKAEKAAEPAAEKPVETPAPPTDDYAPVEAASQPGRVRMTLAELQAMAFPDNPNSLDPEHPMNVNVRNNRGGLVPRAEVDLEKKIAVVGAGAIEGFFTIPLGWHAVDDGKRVLVFDPPYSIQISVSWRTNEEALGIERYGRKLIQQYTDVQPELVVMEKEMDGVFGIGVREAKINDELLDQYFLVRDTGREGLMLVARVTSQGDGTWRALDLAGEIVAGYRQTRGE